MKSGVKRRAHEGLSCQRKEHFKNKSSTHNKFEDAWTCESNVITETCLSIHHLQAGLQHWAFGACLAHLISLYPTCWDTETTWEKPSEEKLTNNPGSWAILSSLFLTVPILVDLATKSDSDLKSRQPTTPILLVQHPSPLYHITSCWVSWAAWCWDMVSLYWATNWQRSVGPGVCKQITSTGAMSPRCHCLMKPGAYECNGTMGAWVAKRVIMVVVVVGGHGSVMGFSESWWCWVRKLMLKKRHGTQKMEDGEQLHHHGIIIASSLHQFHAISCLVRFARAFQAASQKFSTCLTPWWWTYWAGTRARTLFLSWGAGKSIRRYHCELVNLQWPIVRYVDEGSPDFFDWSGLWHQRPILVTCCK